MKQGIVAVTAFMWLFLCSPLMIALLLNFPGAIVLFHNYIAYFWVWGVEKERWDSDLMLFCISRCGSRSELASTAAFGWGSHFLIISVFAGLAPCLARSRDSVHGMWVNE